jgi:hypothetical protein
MMVRPNGAAEVGSRLLGAGRYRALRRDGLFATRWAVSTSIVDYGRSRRASVLQTLDITDILKAPFGLNETDCSSGAMPTMDEPNGFHRQ